MSEIDLGKICNLQSYLEFKGLKCCEITKIAGAAVAIPEQRKTERLIYISKYFTLNSRFLGELELEFSDSGEHLANLYRTSGLISNENPPVLYYLLTPTVYLYFKQAYRKVLKLTETGKLDKNSDSFERTTKNFKICLNWANKTYSEQTLLAYERSLDPVTIKLPTIDQVCVIADCGRLYTTQEKQILIEPWFDYFRRRGFSEETAGILEWYYQTGSDLLSEYFRWRLLQQFEFEKDWIVFIQAVLSNGSQDGGWSSVIAELQALYRFANNQVDYSLAQYKQSQKPKLMPF